MNQATSLRIYDLPDVQIDGLMRYVRAIARRLYRLVGAAATHAIELEDLEAEAYLALVRAVSTYDANRDIPLRGYAGVQVSGHLRHVLRRCDPIGRPNRRAIQTGNAWAERATHDLGRHPTHAEIEAAVPGYRAARARAERRRSVPLDAIDRRNPAPIDVEDLVVRRLESAEVRRLIEQLPPAERAAIRLRYSDELKSRELEAALGLTRAGVYLTLSRAHRRLRHLAGPAL